MLGRQYEDRVKFGLPLLRVNVHAVKRAVREARCWVWKRTRRLSVLTAAKLLGLAVTGRLLGGYRALRVGEAKVPGPEGRNVLTLNVGGAPGAWRLHNSKILQADVVCLQEISMRPTEWEGFARATKGLGYCAYHAPGTPVRDSRGNFRYHAGVATLVHNSVLHAFAGQVQHHDSQVVGVWLQQLCLLNAYTSPSSEGVMAEALGMFWEQEALAHKHWLLVGDHNQEPGDSLVLEALRHWGVVAVRQGPEAQIAQELLSRPGAKAKGARAKFQAGLLQRIWDASS